MSAGPTTTTRTSSGLVLAVLAVLAASQPLMTPDSSVMNVSMAAVASGLGTMITGGEAGTILGRRRAFALGLIFYAAGSLTTALAPDPGHGRRCRSDHWRRSDHLCILATCLRRSSRHRADDPAGPAQGRRRPTDEPRIWPPWAETPLTDPGLLSAPFMAGIQNNPAVPSSTLRGPSILTSHDRPWACCGGGPPVTECGVTTPAVKGCRSA